MNFLRILVAAVFISVPLLAGENATLWGENENNETVKKASASLVTFLTESGLTGKAIELKKIRNRTGMRIDTAVLEDRLYLELKNRGINICPGYQPESSCTAMRYSLNMAINSSERYISGRKVTTFTVSCSLYNLTTGRQDWIENVVITLMTENRE